MLPLFCLRLALGLVGSLLPLNPAQVNPRFFRTHFLVALGLTAVAAVFSWAGGALLLAALVLGLALSFAGSLVWSLERAPAGRAVMVVTFLDLTAALALLEWSAAQPGDLPWALAGSFTSAALLGTATTAMLMGHSYLIAPSMSLTPLLRLLAALFAATGARLVVAAAGLWFWTGGRASFSLEDDTVLWLPLRWGLGFVGPLVLGAMAWQTARLRSTQSATGILYVVVIFCFLGELTAQLLGSAPDWPCKGAALSREHPLCLSGLRTAGPARSARPRHLALPGLRPPGAGAGRRGGGAGDLLPAVRQPRDLQEEGLPPLAGAEHPDRGVPGVGGAVLAALPVADLGHPDRLGGLRRGAVPVRG
jgi:hypothetical protein